MTAEVQPIFATAVYKNVLRSPTPIELEFLKLRPMGSQGSGNMMSRNRNLLDSIELLELKTLFLENIKSYAENVMCISNEIYITNSWLNYTDHNQQHNLHNHPNSILSGCYYIDVESSQPSISFSRITSPFLFNISPTKFNSFNSAEWSVPVTNNMLILFPSSCFHSVGTNYTPNRRISISFDTFIKGTVGPLGSALKLN